jgi:uncharacterized protein YfaS (alpha-2-macroglobulin family)
MKRAAHLLASLFVALLALPPGAHPEEPATVELFSPQGPVKKVRQAAARFSEPMVAFGDPRLSDPFDVDCAAPGKGRWADMRNWVYDFDEDLPGGLACTFTVGTSVRTLAGNPLAGERVFAFTTGGPAILHSIPAEGSTHVDEGQAFVLLLDAEPIEASVFDNAAFTAAGIGEAVGVRILRGEDRKRILEAGPGRALVTIIDRKRGRAPETLEFRRKEKLGDDPRILVLQAKRTFPAEAEVRLLWGPGIRAKTGIATDNAQVLPFRVRPRFTARFSCSRENPKAACIPMQPMTLSFTAPVPRAFAERILLKGPEGRRHKPFLPEAGKGGEEFVHGVTFPGPFPEKSACTVTIPGGIRDDAGRPLANRDRFPLRVATGAFPPLAKFAAPFGIIESSPEPSLPVTLRNLEARVPARMLPVEGEAPRPAPEAPQADVSRDAAPPAYPGVAGRLLPVPTIQDHAVIGWIRRVENANRRWWHDEERDTRGDSLLKGSAHAREFAVPKPGGGKAFEVVGIPLPKTGFFVVEMESRILGSSLLGADRPMFVSAAALVTDMAVHFKWGREASAVWVTSLSSGAPVPGARVAVRIPGEQPLWEGTTDGQGIARILVELPDPGRFPDWQDDPHRGYFVSARTGDDFSFVFSGWQKGIETFRFNLPGGGASDPSIAHTVFDRSLFRAGETVSMKHFFRRHRMQGIAPVESERLPGAVAIRHQGSDQRYEFPLAWSGAGTAETVWTIPKDAKLGEYRVALLARESGAPPVRREIGRYRRGDELHWATQQWSSGSFRVEEYRVPLMRGSIRPVGGPLVRAREAALDLQLSYLAGGGAGGAAVALRTAIEPRSVSFPDFEDFPFANGGVREEVSRTDTPHYYYDGEWGMGWVEGEGDEETFEAPAPGKPAVRTRELVLDAAGVLRAKADRLPLSDRPVDLVAELEYADPNGERQTVATRVPLWPAKLLLGIRPDSWAASKESFKFQLRSVDLKGRPLPGVPVAVDLYQRIHYTHRKRLVGGFYSYEHVTETKRVGAACEGTTDPLGLLVCETASPVSGNVILVARARDEEGNAVLAHRDVWVAGKEEWWFDVEGGDRMDLLPERKRYEPGETARFQVRMPFREATALVTVEREGIVEAFTTTLSGKSPVVEIPVRGSFAPNVFVSVLAVRGRVAGVAPTATVDLGRPAFRLGIAEINVGWKAHELAVAVAPARDVYRVRETARVRIRVRRAAEGPLPPGSEVAVAAVDEGLLELSPNGSWDLLRAMMGRRPYEASTSTGTVQVVGKRHFGLKALPPGGGGGRQATRELFDTLLFWKPRVPLDGNGEAEVEIPLNDSLTSFRIAAVANGGADLFGSGEASIRTTQDLMILSGLPPLVREGDRFRGIFTVRNGSEGPIAATVSAAVSPEGEGSGRQPHRVTLSPGEAKELGWDFAVPHGAPELAWEVTARPDGEGGRDRIRVVQKVIPAVPVRVFQATIAQVSRPLAMEAEIPPDAVPGRGGVTVSFRARLSEGTGAIRYFMQGYPYTCLEQRVSQAVALRDPALWKSVTNALPAYLDGDGLARYFPSPRIPGSDVLTAYILSIAHEAGWEIPPAPRARMAAALDGFIQGKIVRGSALSTADLSIRRMAAMEALSRYGLAKPSHLDPIALEPNLWPTSAVIDWMNVLLRVDKIPDRERRHANAEQVLRSRLNFQGTTMGFSTERTDYLWWLMVSGDVNATRGILTFLLLPKWDEDMPRIVYGAIGRQQRGAWNTTVANAWGVLALEKFSAKYESAPVTGRTRAAFAGQAREIDWAASPDGGSLSLAWPRGREALAVSHEGSGKPWATVQSLAAIPLREPFHGGYRIVKSIAPVSQRNKGVWSRGDVARVTLELEAQADMTWVVVNDPIPGGATILGTGLGRDSGLLARGGRREGLAWPAFTERSFEAFRNYYAFVPKGKWTAEYTVRLNNEGTFHLPPTRVEALYAPEMLGELPNPSVEVRP